MLRLGLLGERLGHSLSPLIHQVFSRETGIALTYTLYEAPAEKLPERLDAMLRELDGFNVTIPYKERVIPRVGRLDEAAQAIGAVNTVNCRGESPTAHNTDVPGFAAMLSSAGIDPAGKPCFVLGTGGASKAVTAALQAMGAASVTLVSRHPAGDEIGYGELPGRFRGLLVNTTPVGMWPRTDACPLTDEALSRLLPRAEGVADVIYNPAETRLTQAARARGIPACTGAVMLAAQALEAERIWTGQNLPDDLLRSMTAAIREALRNA